MLKKSFIFFSTIVILLHIGCEEIPTETIELQTVDYVIQKITAPNVLTFSSTGTEIVTTLTIQNKETVNKVWFDISSDDGVSTLTTGNAMTVSSDSIFTGKYLLNETLLSGRYEISYYVEDKIRIAPDNVRKVGTKSFTYISEAVNLPPEISNLIIPNHIDRGEEFTFSINCVDPNGQNDIKLVYFSLLRPDSSIVYSSVENKSTEFPMFDNGDIETRGDRISGDGIYSLKNTFGSSAQTGNWIFTFNAIDKSDSISNTITYLLNVR